MCRRPGARRTGLPALLCAAAIFLLAATGASAAERHFPETNQVAQGAFLEFFEANGGIDVFGYPRTGEILQHGRTVQYFQRARLEWWPENPPGYRVQLGLLGDELGRGSPPGVQSADPARRYFPETRHAVGGAFLEFWETRGGLVLFGYPIGPEQIENGRTVQWFQRARFEWWPENRQPYQVQPGLLGDEIVAAGLAPVPAASVSRPSAAPGTGRLVVSTGAGDDFYVMDANGANVIRLGRGVDPSLSPDAQRVIFGLWDSGNPGLYVQDVAGGPARLLYPGERVRGPLYSPDGSEIVFYQTSNCIRTIVPPRGDNPGRHEADSCHQVKVIPAGGGADWLPAGQSRYATEPTWAPDGRRIVYRDERALFVVSASQPARQLTEFQPRYRTPAWSPRGGQIAVAIDQNRSHWEIGLVPDDGRVEFRQLTRTPPFQSPPVTSLSPAWSPDGSRIAFATDRDGTLKLWVMNADGSDAVKVSDIPLRSSNSQERFVHWAGR